MQIAPERRARLVKLAQFANFLDDLPSTRFHMPQWFDRDHTENSCGTAACAGGWAATKFAREGWRIGEGSVQLRVNTPWVDIAGFGSYPASVQQRAGWTELFISGGAAFAFFFGITYDEGRYITTHIFDTNKNFLCGDGIRRSLPAYATANNLGFAADKITPAMAAARIRQVLSWYDPALLEEPDGKVPLPSLSAENQAQSATSGISVDAAV